MKEEYVVKFELVFFPDAESEAEAVQMAQAALKKMDGALEGHDPHYEAEFEYVYGGDDEEDD